MTQRIVVPVATERENPKICKKDSALCRQISKKLKYISEFPECGKPLRNVLKGYRRIHIGHYVLIYELNEAEKVITLLKFDHHDDVYYSG